MFAVQEHAFAEIPDPQGGVGLVTLTAGGLLGFVALYRRARATLAKRRPGTGGRHAPDGSLPRRR